VADRHHQTALPFEYSHQYMGIFSVRVSSERWLVTNVIERAIVTGRFLICLYSPQVRQTPAPQPKMTFDLSCQISKTHSSYLPYMTAIQIDFTEFNIKKL